jgi:hypothetical protein
MKKKSSNQEPTLTKEDSKISFEEQELTLCEKLEESPVYQPESRISIEEEINNDREEDELNILTNDHLSSIKTIQSKNSKYIGEVNNNNKKHGIGVCYYSNGDKYIGQFKDGKKEGIGKYVLSNGEVLQGEFSEDHQKGFLEHIGKFGTKKGIANKCVFESGVKELNHNNFIIEGDFDLMKQNSGIGKINKKRITYTGEIRNFESNGFGQSVVKDRYSYQGEHLYGRFNGYGEVFYPDNSKFFGFFRNCFRNGYSLTIYKDGKVSFGKYLNDFKSGPFIVSSKGVMRVEIWNNGFKSKLIEKFETAKNYIKNYYPEFDWINKINLKLICEIYADVSKSDNKVPIPPPIKSVVKSKTENNTKLRTNNQDSKKVELCNNEENKSIIEDSNVD